MINNPVLPRHVHVEAQANLVAHPQLKAPPYEGKEISEPKETFKLPPPSSCKADASKGNNDDDNDDDDDDDDQTPGQDRAASK